MTTHNENTDSFWGHVDALRTCLLKVIGSMGLAACICFAAYPSLVELLSWPLEDIMVERPAQNKALTVHELHWKVVHNAGPEPQVYHPPPEAVSQAPITIAPGTSTQIALRQGQPKLVLFGPTDGFVTALRVSVWAGIALSSPVWLWFILQFVAPGLREKERSLLIPFLACSLCFFGLGTAFAFYASIPIANHFLFGFNASIGQNLWGLANYLSFTSLLLIAHGVAFEGIVILLFMIQLGRVSAAGLAKQRRLVIVGIFIVAAVLTPPDVVTQCLLAAPLLALYEGAILYAKIREYSRKTTPLPAQGPSDPDR